MFGAKDAPSFVSAIFQDVTSINVSSGVPLHAERGCCSFLSESPAIPALVCPFVFVFSFLCSRWYLAEGDRDV